MKPPKADESRQDAPAADGIGPFALDADVKFKRHGGEQVEPEPRLVTVRFLQPSPPYVVGQLLELPPATAERLIRAGLAERAE